MKSGHVTSLSPSSTNSEVRTLLKAPDLCKCIWKTLSRYRESRSLNPSDVLEFYSQEQDVLRELLLINSFEEMMDLLDDDGDGCLNESEQLMLFSLVKERMQATADELCANRQYTWHEKLLQQVAVMEQDVIAYQGELRRRIYDEEWQSHSRFHVSRLRQMRRNWDAKLKTSKEVAQTRLQRMQSEHERQLKHFDETFDFNRAERKIKPREVLLRMQNEERMAAVTGKVNEAKHVRKMLSKVEMSESNRVSAEVHRQLEAQMKQLKRKQLLEYENAKHRAQQAIESLQFKMTSERTRTQKEVSNSLTSLHRLHSHGLTTSKHLGFEHVEQRRHKDQSRGIAKALDEYRQYTSVNNSMDRSVMSLSSVPSSLSISKSVHPLQELKLRVPNFELQKEVLRLDGPVNSKGEMSAKRKGVRKLRSFQEPKSLTELYDERLQLLDQSAV